MLGLGAICAARLAVPILILGSRFPHAVRRGGGNRCGPCGNPAILAYSNKLAPTDQPDIGYAMTFPTMTIVKILFVDIVPALF
jgi:putative transport protein